MLISKIDYTLTSEFITKVINRKFEFVLSSKFCEYIDKKYEEVLIKSEILSTEIKQNLAIYGTQSYIKARFLVFFEGLYGVDEQINIIDNIIFKWNKFMSTHDNCELFSVDLYYPELINPTPERVERDAQRILSTYDQFGQIWGSTMECVHVCVRYPNPGKEPTYTNNVTFLCDRPEYDDEKKINLINMFTFIWDNFIIPGPKALKTSELLQLRAYMEHIASDEEFNACYEKHKTSMDSTITLLTTPPVNDTIH